MLVKFGMANKKILVAAQRPFILEVTNAYRTTPTGALQVLGAIPLWSIEAAVVEISCYFESIILQSEKHTKREC